MAFDSDKWALSFYGVVDERFEVETDLFQLHIHRKSNIENLEIQRSEGSLDIYIPQKWNIEKYKLQEMLRRLLLSEVKWQAEIIFKSHTMLYARRYNIPCERVEMEHRYRYAGKCFSDKRLIKYNPWVICCAEKRHLDYLVCHELAHFFVHNHSQAFWEIVERLYLGLDLHAPTTSNTIKKLRTELVQNKVLTLFMYWGRPSYLKTIYWSGLVKQKTPLIIPHYKEISGRKIEDGFYTTFAIRR